MYLLCRVNREIIMVFSERGGQIYCFVGSSFIWILICFYMVGCNVSRKVIGNSEFELNILFIYYFQLILLLFLKLKYTNLNRLIKYNYSQKVKNKKKKKENILC